MPDTKALALINPQFHSMEIAKAWLAACTDVDEIKRIRRIALAYERDAAEAAALKIWSERRLGEVLLQVVSHEGGRPVGTVANRNGFTLKELGLSREESSAFQILAVMPESDLSQAVAKVQEQHRTPKARSIANAWRQSQRQAETAVISPEDAPPTGPSYELSLLAASVAAGDTELYGCILCDPWVAGTGLSQAQLVALPVAQVAGAKSLLWVWTDHAHLHEALGLIRSWDFQFKSSVIWDTTITGDDDLGAQHLLLLMGSRGGCQPLECIKPSVFRQRPGPHSTKPALIRKHVWRSSPGPHLELWGPAPVDGWRVVGS